MVMAGQSTIFSLDQLEPLAASGRPVVPEGLAGLGHRQDGGVEPVLGEHVDVIALRGIRVRADCHCQEVPPTSSPWAGLFGAARFLLVQAPTPDLADSWVVNLSKTIQSLMY